MINTTSIIPDSKILIVPESNYHKHDYLDIVEPLKGHKTRNWLNRQALHCLPIVIGNQYGFAIKSTVDFTAVWNGGDTAAATKVNVYSESKQIMDYDDQCQESKQIISSHFGSGIVTIQNRFTFRTPPNINLMILNAPNYFIPNLSNMFAVVETDNLRRDFTFNLKITTPNVEVMVKKDDYISAIIPTPRQFVDSFELGLAEDYFDATVITNEQLEMDSARAERRGRDTTRPHGVGKRYWRGEDTQGNKFKTHQRKL